MTALVTGPSVPWWVQLQAGLESLLRVLRAHRSAPQHAGADRNAADAGRVPPPSAERGGGTR
jgi:hypothetical protein